MEQLRIGLLGLGTVGAGTAKLLLDQAALLKERTGVDMKLVRIATRFSDLDPSEKWDGVALTENLRDVVEADDIDVVVELIGGYSPAREMAKAALSAGKHVVTANKALIAEYGEELLAEARAKGCVLAFEAAVGGTIPILKAVREGLAANRIDAIHGILNGTCNYILTEMREKGLSFETVLMDAQAAGYAEADPSFDVDGIDTAHKLAILAAMAFGTPIDYKQVTVEGIRNISEVDIAWAQSMGYRIKLLAIGRRDEKGVELRVHPAMVSTDSMVATVEGVFNAVFVHGDYAGTTMHYGRGAGREPTASAVVADLIDLARDLKAGARRRVSELSTLPEHLRPLMVTPVDDLTSEFYLRLAVVDRAGVLAEVTDIFRRCGISIKTIHQEGRSGEDRKPVPLVVVTHETSERSMREALAELEGLECVHETPHLIRIESTFA